MRIICICITIKYCNTKLIYIIVNSFNFAKKFFSSISSICKNKICTFSDL